MIRTLCLATAYTMVVLTGVASATLLLLLVVLITRKRALLHAESSYDKSFAGTLELVGDRLAHAWSIRGLLLRFSYSTVRRHLIHSLTKLQYFARDGILMYLPALVDASVQQQNIDLSKILGRYYTKYPKMIQDSEHLGGILEALAVWGKISSCSKHARELVLHYIETCSRIGTLFVPLYWSNWKRMPEDPQGFYIYGVHGTERFELLFHLRSDSIPETWALVNDVMVGKLSSNLPIFRDDPRKVLKILDRRLLSCPVV